MKTIGAKELRTHLDQVFGRVLSGEDIIVNHRLKGSIRLSTVHTSSIHKPERLAGLRAFDVSTKRNSPYDSSKSIKELYNESLIRKYGH